MLMVPEAWQGNALMDPKKAAFYEWAACQMEPWDGPALFTFADGRFCGANLDRNGLRPCRYYIMDDDRIICASEVGTIPVEPESVIQKGRLQPGRMLLVDTVAGRLIDDSELKAAVSSRQDFRSWLDKELLSMPVVLSQLTEKNLDLAAKPDESKLQEDPLLHAFGYTFEQVSLLLAPMASDEKEALGSMGNDAPWPVSPTPRSCSTSTSASSSPRLPTRRLTPSASPSSCPSSVTLALRATSSRWMLLSADAFTCRAPSSRSPSSTPSRTSPRCAPSGP